MNILYVDESHRQFESGQHLYSLTGVLVPADRHDDARKRFYALLHERVDVGGLEVTTREGRRFRIADGMQINEPPPELHGVSLLPDRDDEEKVIACQKVVDVVVNSGLTVFRVCLSMDHAQQVALRTEGDRYLFCWMNLVDLLSPVLEHAHVAVVFDDGNNEIKRTIPRFVQMQQFVRAVYPRPGRSLGRADPYVKLLGEAAFADSKDSIMVQVADVLSYLLLALDAVQLDPPQGEFKRSLAEVACTLPSAVLTQNRSAFQFDGKHQVLTPWTI